MQGYFLDTSVAIEYIRGNKKIIRFVDDLKEGVFIDYIVVAELYEGVYRVEKSKQIKNGIEQFMSGTEILSINFSTATEFGKIRADLRNNGNSIEDFDIMIAASCLTNELALVTLNKKHFERIKDLEVLTPEEVGK